MKKGFTLIELLVVIAIIGILASVVLASLNTARNKGGDAAVAANLANVRAQAELYYDDNGDYGTDSSSCFSGMFSDDSTIAKAIAAAASAGTGTTVCNSTATTWAISATLKSVGTWCVDSAGTSEKGLTSLSSGLCG